MKRKVDLSIVISNYNTRDLLRQTISSIYQTTKKIHFEIIVVDDASTDDSLSMLYADFPKVVVIKNKINSGYSKSYNKGTKVAKGRYILHLNSDVIFLKAHSLEKAVEFLDQRPNVGILGCKLLKINNKLDQPCRRSYPTLSNVFFQSIGLSRLFPRSRAFNQYYLGFLDEDEICEVDCIMGAFMMIRRNVIKKIGYLDERFFIYGEDIDYCHRAKMANWKIIYYPKVVVRHYHGGTTRKFKWKHVWLFHYAMFQYYNKHHLRNNSLPISCLVYSAIISRFLITIAIECLKSLSLWGMVKRIHLWK